MIHVLVLKNWEILKGASKFGQFAPIGAALIWKKPQFQTNTKRILQNGWRMRGTLEANVTKNVRNAKMPNIISYPYVCNGLC
jgi:hypothetical protein